MKRRIFNLAAIISAFALIYSCTQSQLDHMEDGKDEVVESEDSVEMGNVTFCVAAPDTKTIVDEDGVVSWTEGDVISIYYISNGAVKTTSATAVGDGQVAEFTAAVETGIEEIYAAYPQGAGSLTADGVFSINTLPAELPDGSFKQANYAVAHGTLLWEEHKAACDLTFNNAVGIFRLEIPAGGVLAHGETIKSILVEDKASTEVPFNGSVTYSYDSAADAWVFTPEVSGASNSAEIVLSEEVSGAGGYVYVHALPFVFTDGLCFSVKSTDDKWLPAAVTKDGKAITLEAGHIKPAGNLDQTIIWDWYYTPEGTGDGKTEATSGNTAAFTKLINDTKYVYGQKRLRGATVHLGEGTFKPTESLVVDGTETGDITVVGVLPVGTTVIQGHGHVGTPTWQYKSAMNLNIQGMSLNYGSAPIGSIINTEGATGKLRLENVNIYKGGYESKSELTGGAPVYLTTSAEFRNCRFTSNGSVDAGGILYTDGAGIVTMQDVELLSSTAQTSGGAMYLANTELVKMQNCRIESNTSGDEGGSIYMLNSALEMDDCLVKESMSKTHGAVAVFGAESKAFISRTYFYGNDLNNDGAGWVRDEASCVYSPEGKVGVYNCTFNYNGRKNTGNPCSNIRATNYIVANSTFWLYHSSDYGMIMNGATKEHQATLVNSILFNSHTNAAATVVGALAKNATYNYLDCGYNLMHAPAFPDYLSVIAGDETSDLAFGVNPGDYLDDSNKCSAWDGTTGLKEDFVKCKISQLENLIKANTSLGADFWNWLTTTKTAEGYKLSEVDVRGVQRSDLNALWPGSYQN